MKLDNKIRSYKITQKQISNLNLKNRKKYLRLFQQRMKF